MLSRCSDSEILFKHGGAGVLSQFGDTLDFLSSLGLSAPLCKVTPGDWHSCCQALGCAESLLQPLPSGRQPLVLAVSVVCPAAIPLEAVLPALAPVSAGRQSARLSRWLLCSCSWVFLLCLWMTGAGMLLMCPFSSLHSSCPARCPQRLKRSCLLSESHVSSRTGSAQPGADLSAVAFASAASRPPTGPGPGSQCPCPLDTPLSTAQRPSVVLHPVPKV